MRNISVLFFSLLFILYSASCSNLRKDKEKKKPESRITQVEKGMISKITCLNSPEISYHLYLPSGTKDSNRYPLILFLDPHARGALPLTKYKHLADSFGFIIAGSDCTQNGQEIAVTMDIIRKIIQDATKRFPADHRRITLSGFSGGARQAGVAIQQMPEVGALISCGAGMAFDPAAKVKSFSYLAFIGNTDFNYLEMKQLDRILSSSDVNFYLLEYPGKHEWPPTEVFTDAFLWLKFDAAKRNIVPHDIQTENTYWKKAMMELAELDSKGRYLEEYRLALKMKKFLNDSFARDLCKRLDGYSEYLIQKQAETILLEKEVAKQQEFMNAFRQFQLHWFLSEADKLFNLMNSANIETAAMYKRLLNWLSLASNMNASAAFENDYPQLMREYLLLYQKVDPENPDVFFLFALYYGKTNDKDSMYGSLENAVKNGFNDKKRMLAEPVFLPYHDEERFKEVISSLKDQGY